MFPFGEFRGISILSELFLLNTTVFEYQMIFNKTDTSV